MCSVSYCYQCYRDLKRGAQFVLVHIKQFSATIRIQCSFCGQACCPTHVRQNDFTAARAPPTRVTLKGRDRYGSNTECRYLHVGVYAKLCDQETRVASVNSANIALTSRHSEIVKTFFPPVRLLQTPKRDQNLKKRVALRLFERTCGGEGEQ